MVKKYFLLLVFLLGTQATIVNAYEVYSATSFCRATNAVGYSRNKLTPEKALNTAIENCIGNGGVPSCCRNRARISDTYHAAISHCTLTGAKGVGVAQTLIRAMTKAVEKCVDNGGIRQCCENKVSH